MWYDLKHTADTSEKTRAPHPTNKGLGGNNSSSKLRKKEPLYTHCRKTKKTSMQERRAPDTSWADLERCFGAVKTGYGVPGISSFLSA